MALHFGRAALLAAMFALASCSSIGWEGDAYSTRFISDEWRADYYYDDGIGPPSCHPASLNPDFNATPC